MPLPSTEETYRRWGSTNFGVVQFAILLAAVTIAAAASGSWIIIPVMGGVGTLTIVFGTLFYRWLGRRLTTRDDR